MKNMKKLLAMMLMMATVFFIACDDDEGSTPLTTEQAQTEMESLSTDLNTYFAEMTTTEGATAMANIMALMQLDDPFTTTKSARTSVIPNIQKFILPVQPKMTKSTYEAVPFDFDLWVGTYTWDAAHYMWVPDFGNPSDKIIFKFPAEGSTTNNIILTIHNYTEVKVTGTDEYGYPYYDYMPTDILADLYVDNEKVIELDLEATWTTSGDNAGEPTSLDISVFLTPFTFSGDFDQSSTAASVNFNIKHNSDQIFATGLSATFGSNTEEPITIGGYIQLMNVKIEANIDVAGLEAVFEDNTYTTADEINTAINDEIDAVVYVDGVKAADILIEFTTVEGMYSIPFEMEDGFTIYVNVFFKYADGTTEQAAPYFASFIAGVEAMLKSFGFTDDGM